MAQNHTLKNVARDDESLHLCRFCFSLQGSSLFQLLLFHQPTVPQGMQNQVK